MDESQGVPIHHGRRSSSRTNGQSAPIYRRNSNLSSSSFLGDVEMAHDEVFGGPMAESVPTSTSSFAHRRGRADSTASFTYYQEDGEESLSLRQDDSAIMDDDEYGAQYAQDGSPDLDLEAGELDELRRTSSGYSRSVHDHLLRRDSARTEGSKFDRGYRTSQKIYIVAEDLTIVVAGFRTSTLGFALYTTICVFTLGLGYLLLRWLPRWHVRIVGTPCALRDCSWSVIEVRFYHFPNLSHTPLVYTRVTKRRRKLSNPCQPGLVKRNLNAFCEIV